MLLGFIVVMPLRANHDVAFFLYGGDLLLHGKTLYIDWSDFNPPLIFYLGVIPALVSKVLSIHVIFAFSLLVFALVTWSAVCIRRQLMHAEFELDQWQVGVILVCWILYSLYCFQENDFGQRDHLFMVLFVPYFVFRWIRWEYDNGRFVTAIVTGIAAAIGSCLKPYFLLVPLLCEAYWLICYRRWGKVLRPEIAAFVLTGLAYGVHFFFLPETELRELIDHLIPQILDSYPKFMVPQSPIHVLNHNTLFIGIAAAVFPFLTTPSRSSELWGLARSASILVLGGVIIYLLHFKGFSYHFLIMEAGTALIVGITLAQSELLRFKDTPQGPQRFTFCLSRRQAFVIVAILTVSMSTVFGLRFFFKTAQRFADTPLTQILSRYSHKGDYVLVIATDHGVIWPSLLQMERKQASRVGTYAAFPLLHLETKSASKQGNPEHSSESNARKEELRTLRELDEDIGKFKPTVIVVHDPVECLGCPKGFRLLEYLKMMGVFSRSMKGYRHVATVDDFLAYVPEGR
jgi:hypothetical protein